MSKLPFKRSFLETLVKQAGKRAETLRRSGISAKHKSDNSLVTKADEQVEEYIISRITSRFPDHKIWGEESGGKIHDNKPLWIIDPIEGTTNYSHGTGLYGPQLAFMYQGEITAAALYEPSSDTLVSAIHNHPTHLNRQTITLKPQSLDRTTLLFDTARDFNMVKRFMKSDIILNFRSFRRLGSLVTDVIFILNQPASVYFCFSANLYDVAPAAFILKQAGYTTLDDSLTDWRPSQQTSLFAFHPFLKERITTFLDPLLTST